MIFFEKLLNGKSVKKVWFLSYILIIIIPILIGGYVYNASYNAVKETAINSNLKSMTVVKNSINDSISKMFETQSLIHLKDSLSDLAFAEKNQKDIEYMMHKAGREINSSLSNPVLSYYIYYKNLDSVIGSNLVYPTYTFYDIYFKNRMQYPDFLDKLNKENDIEFHFANDDNKNIIMWQRIPNMHKNNAILIMMLHKSYINSLLNDNEISQNGIFLIFDRDDNVLFSKSEQLSSMKFEEFEKKEKIKLTLNGIKEKYIVTSFSSAGINYVFLTPVRIFLQQTFALRTTMIISAIIIFIVSLILINYSIRANYRPIGTLMDNLSLSGDDEDEYKLIANSIMKIKNENKKLEHFLSNSRTIVKSGVISTLLTSDYFNDELIRETLTHFGFEIETEDFIVVAFSVTNYGNLVDDNGWGLSVTSEGAQMLQNTTDLIMSNVLGELLSEKNNVLFGEYGEDMLCIINIKDGNLRFISSIISECCNKAKAFISENFGIDFLSGVGSICSGLINVKVSYNNAVEALRYNSFSENNDTVFYSDISVPDKFNYFYSEETEGVLTGLIKSGDYDKSREYVNSLITKFINTGGYPYGMLKKFIFDISSTLMKLYCDNVGEITPEIYGCFEKLYSCEGSDIMPILDTIIEFLCVDILSENSKNTMAGEIKNYIEENYKDFGLNINSIGQHFGFVPSYVSKLFKDEYGENLLNYITNYRIKKAKDLLSSTNSNLEEIAAQVGITNKVTFIRSFKKVVGITPGEFRKL